jgi:hypothetical protein
MTDEEFCELMALAEGWEDLARKDLLARLRAGGRVYR